MTEDELQQQFFEMLMESQYWSPSQLVAYQREQLEQLLRHARANVPFYENRLDSVFRPGGGIDWDRWHEIPIVTRTDMRDHRDAMLARNRPRGHGDYSTIESSGSTGLPIKISTNRLMMLATAAIRWRAQRWHGVDWSKTYTARGGFDPDALYPDGKQTGIWGPPWDAAARAGRSFTISRRFTSEETLEFLSRTATAYYSSVPKNVHTLALEAERLGIFASLESIFAHGEHVGADDKAAFRRVFGAACLEHYSSKEGGHMAHPCPDGPGLHVSAENLFLEIVDAEGAPCPVGVEGRVVITPFVSTIQPLIRYDQGDIAAFAPPCSCGRVLPLLKSISGRSMAIFTHPDGRAAARMLPDSAREALDATMWQIAQVGPLDFEIRYVPRDTARLGDEHQAEAAFREIFFDDAAVKMIRLPRIETTAAGKFLEYVNEWRPSQT
ncbi:phenylacetate--CoA ligase family protein [Devosia sp.]|uniref:phenylacetate--CoA ligase family protein n=1 Tax=Devosia sp. TaxID=1871048 RepID=UPI003A8CCA7B